MPGGKIKKIQGSVKEATKKDKWEPKANKKKAYKIYSWGKPLAYLLIKLPISDSGELHELNYDKPTTKLAKVIATLLFYL